MIQNNKAANRYAKAFFVQTKENHELEKTLKDCQLILKTLVQEKELLGILKNPTVIIVVELSSTTPLSPELKESIKKKVSLTADVRLVEKIDKSLIGGFIINRGDKQYDASIRKKIRNTKRVFKV